MFKFFMYVLVISCLLGQVLVTKNKRSGYLIWIVADGILAVQNFLQYPNPLALPQGILWTLYFGISVWGFLVWRKR